MCTCDLTAEKPQHGSKQIRGILRHQCYTLLLLLSSFRFDSQPCILNLYDFSAGDFE